ncbi:hypothetical protein ACWGQ5_53025, partial [Streptomyces sp. NPDC055722]
MSTVIGTDHLVQLGLHLHRLGVREHHWATLLPHCGPHHIQFLSGIGALFRSSHRKASEPTGASHEAP